MHPLEAILQLQVGSDQAAVLNLPYIVDSLKASDFHSSSHLQKWVSRVTSLIHAKHPGARWAGLCLALQTSILSKDVMLETAQSWVGVVLPILSKNESAPVIQASIRLMEYIFLSALSLPEFQRQVAAPSIPKFSVALVHLAENSEEGQMKHLALTSLTHLVQAYPTLNRQLHPTLVSLSFRQLSGSATTPTPKNVIEDGCSLHSVLHFTGGKVGAASLWRKSLDTALANSWSAFSTLRSTFPPVPQMSLAAQPTFENPPTDPVVAIPLSLDRLRCSVALTESLLKATTARPVSICAGSLVGFTLTLLRCTLDEPLDVRFDASCRALEVSIIPEIWKLGCGLVSQLATTLRHHLNPYLSRMVSHILLHLEDSLPKKHHIPFIRCLTTLLSSTFQLHSSIPPTRLVKALLPHLGMLLSQKSDVVQQAEVVSTAASSKKGKKRARGYEGDEVFKVGRTVLCPSSEDREIILASLDALEPLIPNPQLASPIRALSKRLLVSLLLELQKHAPSTVSPDLAFQGQVYAKVLTLCNRYVLPEPSGWTNSAAGLVINAISGSSDCSTVALESMKLAQRELDVLLHPRLPPLIRRQPPIEAIFLLRSEKVQDDEAARAALNLTAMEDVLTENTSMRTQPEPSALPTTEPQVQPAPKNIPPAPQPTFRLPPIAVEPVPVSVASAPVSAASAPTVTLETNPIAIAPAALAPKTTNQDAKLADMSFHPAIPVLQQDINSSQSKVVGLSTAGSGFRMAGVDDSDDDEEMPPLNIESDSE